MTWASKALYKPVKWTAERRESFLTDAHGRDHYSDAEMALSADGRLVASGGVSSLADLRDRGAISAEEYEAKKTFEQYDAVDARNRLAASELERRWNEKLERVTQLERTYAQAEREAEWNLTAEERAAITELSRDLPAIWSAETTTNQERKQLLRMAIDSVQLDGIRQAGQIEIQIHWRSGAITSLSVRRSAPGEGSLKTPAEAVSRIHKLAPRRTYAEIATALNRAGLRSAFGRRFTSQHVGYICRRDGLGGRKPRSSSNDTPEAGGPAES